MLLPGTTAKLEPPEGANFMDGLEVRVAFGGVWKQSLSELSGGQRSLLALSLILALLLFKPAPLYILDEVSHQNEISLLVSILLSSADVPQLVYTDLMLRESYWGSSRL